jgi:flagellar basal-body rod modification protein FlgD
MTVESATLDRLADFSSVATSSKKTSKNTELGRDQFLKLLITQLKNQDPLNPMESVEFTSQLAQFSSLEQLFSVGDSLQAIKTSLQLQEGDQMLQYIGRKVVSQGNTLTVQGGDAGPASFSLDDDAEVSVSIYSSAGTLVRRLSMGWQKKGTCQVPWDGKDQTGKAVPDGDYSYRVEALDAEGGLVASQTFMTGEVTGVRHENGRSILLLGNRQIQPENIREVSKL